MQGRVQELVNEENLMEREEWKMHHSHLAHNAVDNYRLKINNLRMDVGNLKKGEESERSAMIIGKGLG